MSKSLAQIAYEAFTKANATPAVPWEQIADPSPRRGSPVAMRAWAAVAIAVERELRQRAEAAQKTFVESHPDRPVKCRCGARFMAGESHVCNDNPELLKKLAGAA
jgi:hypothetical protein